MAKAAAGNVSLEEISYVQKRMGMEKAFCKRLKCIFFSVRLIDRVVSTPSMPIKITPTLLPKVHPLIFIGLAPCRSESVSCCTTAECYNSGIIITSLLVQSSGRSAQTRDILERRTVIIT